MAAVGNIGQCAKARSSNVTKMRTIQNRKVCILKKMVILFNIKAPTNFVPAVAVKRGEQVLFRIIGRKGYVGGFSRRN